MSDAQSRAVEAVAKALARADGLIFDEVCGYETDVQECDSSTCVAAQYEDHDPDWARTIYLRHAQAAIAAMPTPAPSDQGAAEALTALAKGRKFTRQAQAARGRAYCRTGGTATAQREFENAAKYDDRAVEQFAIVAAFLERIA